MRALTLHRKYSLTTVSNRLRRLEKTETMERDNHFRVNNFFETQFRGFHKEKTLISVLKSTRMRSLRGCKIDARWGPLKDHWGHVCMRALSCPYLISRHVSLTSLPVREVRDIWREIRRVQGSGHAFSGPLKDIWREIR